MHDKQRIIMRKSDVMHKTEMHNVSQFRQRPLLGPLGTCTKNFGHVVLEIFNGDISADRQTHRHTQTYASQYSAPLPGWSNNGLTIGL